MKFLNLLALLSIVSVAQISAHYEIRDTDLTYAERMPARADLDVDAPVEYVETEYESVAAPRYATSRPRYRHSDEGPVARTVRGAGEAAGAVASAPFRALGF
jgi:hypothetical protein